MHLHIIVGAAATAFVLSTGLALAQPQEAATAQCGQAAAIRHGTCVGSGSELHYLKVQ